MCPALGRGGGGTLLHKHIKSLLSSNARPKGPTTVQAASPALYFSGCCKQGLVSPDYLCVCLPLLSTFPVFKVFQSPPSAGFCALCPHMSQHMDADLRFQGSGSGYQKAQSVQAKIKIKGFFLWQPRESAQQVRSGTYSTSPLGNT